MSEDSARYLTAQEAIQRLRVSRATFYNYAKQLGRFRRIGDRRVYYRTEDVDELAKHRAVARPNENEVKQ